MSATADIARMNFLDPNQWKDLEAMEKEHETLTDDLIKQLHQRLKPYFLRRVKGEVLKLPPKARMLTWSSIGHTK
jgi:SNF2 family DNA or RNA helicase